MRWALIPELLYRLARTCKKDTVSLSSDASIKQPVATFNADSLLHRRDAIFFLRRTEGLYLSIPWVRECYPVFKFKKSFDFFIRLRVLL